MEGTQPERPAIEGKNITTRNQITTKKLQPETLAKNERRKS
jgi:hypothetical protein